MMDRNELDGRMSRMDAATLRPHSGGRIDWKPGDPVPDIAGECIVSAGRSAHFRIPTMKPGERLVLDAPNLNTRCTIIADAVVPEYRLGGKERCCTGHWAKRWSAAYEGAEMALKGDG